MNITAKNFFYFFAKLQIYNKFLYFCRKNMNKAFNIYMLGSKNVNL